MNTLKSVIAALALNSSTVCLSIAGLPGDWQIRETPVTTHLTAVACAPGLLVAVGQAATILTSGNGSSWSAVPYEGSGDFHCATFGKGMFVAGGTLDCLLAISPDGKNWTPVQTTIGQQTHFGVTFGAGRFVAVGRGGLQIPTRIFVSTNGIDWQPANVPPTTNTLRAVTFGNGKYVAVGERGTILTSADAITWTLQISGTEHLLRSVIFTGREFLAGGDSSILLTSGDGISWVTVPFSSFDINALATSGTAVVAAGSLGSDGRIQASAEGLSWSASMANAPGRLRAVMHYALGKFFAVGDDGLILESGMVADAPVNAWSKPSDGYWDEAFWSLGHLPSWADQSIVFTNAGSNMLQIDATTARDYPDSLNIRELVLYGTPEDAQNTLFLNNAGWAVPLKIDKILRIPPTVSLLSVNSAIEGSRLDLSGRVTLADTHAWFRDAAYLGVIGRADVTQSNGYFTAISTILGQNFPATWRQSGGTNQTQFLNLNRGSAYDLNAGWLQAATLQAGEGQFVQSGGTNVSGILSVSSYRLLDGLLVTSEATVSATSGGGFVQAGGTHQTRGGLHARGTYELLGGALIANNVIVYGQLRLAGGEVANGMLFLSGGMLTATGAFSLGYLIVNPEGGRIDYGSGAASLRFRPSYWSWSPQSVLIVTNWVQGEDQLFIGHDQTGLPTAHLSRIRFVNPGGFSPGLYSARLTSAGEVVPVPKIINYQRSANHLVLNWPEGYRLWTATNVAGPYSLITNAISPHTASYDTDPQRFFILRNAN